MGLVVKIVFPTLIDDTNQIVLRRSRVRQNSIHFALDQRGLIIRIIDAQSKVLVGGLILSQDSA